MAHPKNQESIEASPRRKWTAEAAEASDYIAQMTAELAAMARGAQLDLLAYFLEMAQMEAQAEIGRNKLDLVDVTPADAQAK